MRRKVKKSYKTWKRKDKILNKEKFSKNLKQMLCNIGRKSQIGGMDRGIIG